MFRQNEDQVSEVQTESKPLIQAERVKYSIGKATEKSHRDVVRALECFLNTSETKARFNHYFVDGHELYYRTVCTEDGQAELREDLIAKKIQRPDGSEFIIGNSSALGLIGRSVTYGRESLNRAETEVQRRLALCVPMIPFSVFDQAKLDLDTMVLVERGAEESVTRDRRTGKYDKKTNKEIIETEIVHFTGASLFSVDDQFFLFDIDRRELKHRVFNPFLVRLPVPVTSIAEAYECLKPEIVKAALAKGVDVKRQGEFFFVPVSALESKRLDKIGEEFIIPLTLRAGQNRPNTAKGIQLVENKPVPNMRDMGWDDRREMQKSLEGKAADVYVTGKVSHTGREHADLILKGWYRAYPNTATQSFTITGDID